MVSTALPASANPPFPWGGREAVIFFAVSINQHQRREDTDVKWERKTAPPIGEQGSFLDFNSLMRKVLVTERWDD